MANRNFKRKQALESEIKEIYAEVAIAGSGAPTLTRGTGVASVTRDSAGVYIVTLQDKYSRLMHVSVAQVVAAAEDLGFQVEAHDVTSAKTVTIRCVAAGVETDPSSGSSLLISLQLKNTSVI